MLQKLTHLIRIIAVLSWMFIGIFLLWFTVPTLPFNRTLLVVSSPVIFAQRTHWSKRGWKRSQLPVNFGTRWWAKLICVFIGMEFEIKGEENLRETSQLLMYNHTSNIGQFASFRCYSPFPFCCALTRDADAFCLASTAPSIKFIFKRELLFLNPVSSLEKPVFFSFDFDSSFADA
jgi:1-acyl-sn-glycerol-3-phosphate acyltransferase